MNIKNSDNQPLVSIILVTFNSGKYILETLDSIKAQTYANIELIISDDCSSDDSVSIIEEWALQNINRFKKVEILKSNINTGIPANCNRGLDESNGEWLKYIAGDDSLKDNCVEDYIDYINSSNEKILVIHSEVDRYFEQIRKDTRMVSLIRANDMFNIVNIKAIDQYNLLLRKFWISAPTLFFKKEVFEKNGKWDEEIPFEDWPYLLKLTKNGFKIHFLNKSTTNYRIRNDSYSNSYYSDTLFHPRFKEVRLMVNKYFMNDLTKCERFFENLEYNRKLIFIKFKLDKIKLFNRIINKPFTMLFRSYKKISIYTIKKKVQRNYI